MAEQPELRAFYERWIPLASKMTGGVLGALTGHYTGMLVAGAMLSPYVAHNLERVGKDVLDRHLAPRQKIRVGRAIMVGAMRIEERRMAGEQMRSDGFFDSVNEGRSAADEVAEHTLMSAMNAAEERKVDHLGALIASIAMDASIDQATGHQLIRIAERISFRAFALLEMLHKDEARSYDPLSTNGEGETAATVQAVRAELFELSQFGLVEKKNHRAMVRTLAIAGVADIEPSLLYLSSLGRLLRDALELEKLPDDDPVRRRTKRQLAVLMRKGAPGTSLDGGKF